MITCMQAGNMPAIQCSSATTQLAGSRTLTEVVCLALYGSPLKPGGDQGSLRVALEPLIAEGFALWNCANGPGWLVPHLELIADGKSWTFRPDTDDENNKITLNAFKAAQRWLSRARRMGFVYGLPTGLAEKVLSLAKMSEGDAIRAALAEADRNQREEAAINVKAAEFYKLLSEAVATRQITLKAIATDPRINTWLPRSPGASPHQTIPTDYFELPMVHNLFDNELEADRFSPAARTLEAIFDRIDRENAGGLIKWLDVKVPPEHVGWLLSKFLDDGKATGERRLSAASQLQRTAPGQGTPRAGRRKGQGSFKPYDEPLLAEMKELIEQGKAASPERASHLVAAKAMGSGTLASRADRLAKRFRAAQNIDRNNSD